MRAWPRSTRTRAPRLRAGPAQPPAPSPRRAVTPARSPLLLPRLLAALSAVLALTLPSAGRATTYLELTPAQMLDRADIVFVGTVTDIGVTLRGGQPWTDVTFDVQTPLEGIPTGADGNATGPARLSFLGGDAAGGPTLTVSGMPHFVRGDRVLIFAYDQAYASPIVGFRQGLWRITTLGLIDEDGRQLSLDANGGLVAGGSGAPLQQIVDAIRQHLGAAGSTP